MYIYIVRIGRNARIIYYRIKRERLIGVDVDRKTQNRVSYND